MKRFSILFTVLFLLSPLFVWTQHLSVKKDLRSEWLIYKNERYEPFINDKNKSTIYFWINAENLGRDKLYIKSHAPLTLFVDGKVAGNGTLFLLSIDSLSKVFTASSLLVGIHSSSHSASHITTHLMGANKITTSEQPELLDSSSFRDFTILAGLILVTMLVVITRTNPKLASDYLSFKKIFSLREADDTKIYSRITSSTNVLFYLYCSLMISFYLIIIFHFVSDRYPVSLSFQSRGFGEAWLNWLELTLIVLAILFVKIVLIFGFSFLFGINEIAGIHFFNLVRMLVIFFGLLTTGLFVYFISRGYNENVHAILLGSFAWIMAGWMILIFLKLSSKMSTSMFHLFSYICATELIPFLIIVKVLYN